MKIYLRHGNRWKLYGGDELSAELAKREVEARRRREARRRNGVILGNGVRLSYFLGYEPFRGYSRTMMFSKRGLEIQAGCRTLSIPDAREHWGPTYSGKREIGDHYLRLLDYVESEAKALGWLDQSKEQAA